MHSFIWKIQAINFTIPKKLTIIYERLNFGICVGYQHFSVSIEISYFFAAHDYFRDMQ